MYQMQSSWKMSNVECARRFGNVNDDIAASGNGPQTTRLPPMLSGYGAMEAHSRQCPTCSVDRSPPQLSIRKSSTRCKADSPLKPAFQSLIQSLLL